MKTPRLLPIVLSAVCISFGSHLAAETVSIHFQKVFSQYRELQVEDRKLQQEVAEYRQLEQRNIQALQQKQQEFAALRQQAAQAGLSEAERQTLVEQATAVLESIAKMEQELRQERDSYRKELEEKGLRLRRRYVEKINKKVAEMAGKNGWDVVIDASATAPNGMKIFPYITSAMDKTALVITELNAGEPETGAEDAEGDLDED